MGTPSSRKVASASPLASRCGTLSAHEGRHAIVVQRNQRRVSSSVDQMTCRTPAPRAASAIVLASAFSRSGEVVKKVTQNAP